MPPPLLHTANTKFKHTFGSLPLVHAAEHQAHVWHAVPPVCSSSPMSSMCFAPCPFSMQLSTRHMFGSLPSCMQLSTKIKHKFGDPVPVHVRLEAGGSDDQRLFVAVMQRSGPSEGMAIISQKVFQ